MIRKSAKPFLKWAGGKTQLISEIERNLPNSTIDTYVEPFVGSGAVLFWVLGEFSQLERAVVNDINEDLINTYKTIQSTPKELISILEILQNEYHSLENLDNKKKEYYYQKRELFNNRKQNKTEHSALFIFLNRTCFNGLYRNYTSSNTLFYFDPPYKPLSETSSFNSYAKDEFNDEEQIRLKNFCDKLDTLGHSWILSNSDVKGKNEEDNFFDDLYANFIIKRVDAKRSINANPQKRGFLTELLITNQAVAL